MEKLTVKIQKLRDGAVVPHLGSEYAAGADLYACLENDVVIAPGATAFIPTGIASAIPAGYAGFVFARSGLACKSGLAPANKVGVIDADYRGEIMVALHNHSSEAYTVTNEQRIAQMCIMPVPAVEYIVSDSLDDTARGAGGFGSTGK